MLESEQLSKAIDMNTRILIYFLLFSLHLP